ncbi:MAG: HEAT repeat domain-containing protein [Planctomycetia bacterium]|nr:HEAT repeat domain-containing protein [Planctomycetia bacterium]
MESAQPSEVEQGVELLRIAGPAAEDLAPRVLTLLEQWDGLSSSASVLLVIDPSGERWVPELQKMIVSSNKRQREKVANWLRIMAQSRASFTLSSLPFPEAANGFLVAMLVTALDDDNERVRLQGATGLEALGMGARKAEPALVRHLVDEDSIRKHCCKALRNLGRPGIKALVENIAVSPDHYASSLLSELAAATMTSELKFYEAMRDRNHQKHPELPWAVEALEACAEQGVPAIIEALKSPNPKVRESAASALNRVSTTSSGLVRTLPPLDANAWDDVVAIRQRGEKASAALQSAIKQAQPALQAALDDDNPGVRRHAAAALKALQGSNPTP